jgi:Arc/MetJ family transcription regulator
MRTTVSIDDELLRRAKRAAEDSGSTLSQLVEQALRAALSVPRAQRKLKPLPTFRGTGPAARVDFSDNAAVRALELEWEIKDRPDKYPWVADSDR